MSELNYQSLNDCHESGLLNIWADADVIRYTNMRLPCTLEDIRKRIVIFRSMDVFSVMQDGELIGIIGCPPVDKEKLQFGLFYKFCKSSWGHGNATAAAKWILKYMKQKYINPMLFADVVVDNAAREKILQKFCFEKISEELIERDGIKHKVHNYKLCV